MADHHRRCNPTLAWGSTLANGRCCCATRGSIHAWKTGSAVRITAVPEVEGCHDVALKLVIFQAVGFFRV
ncbi:MAG: hypothetical protein R6U98_17335, partial [Pirellulaceae bacterium]